MSFQASPWNRVHKCKPSLIQEGTMAVGDTMSSTTVIISGRWLLQRLTWSLRSSSTTGVGEISKLLLLVLGLLIIVNNFNVHPKSSSDHPGPNIALPVL